MPKVTRLMMDNESKHQLLLDKFYKIMHVIKHKPELNPVTTEGRENEPTDNDCIDFHV
jgi:hypothetical protein